MKLRTSLYLLAVGMLVLSLLVDDVDARRKVLRGRKAITRTYYRGTSIPGWSIAVLVGVAMLALGGGAYAGLSKYVIGSSEDESAA